MATNQAGTLLYVANSGNSTVSVFMVASDGTLTPVQGPPFSTRQPSSSIAAYPAKACGTIDTTPPSCALTARGIDASGKQFIKVTCQDSGSGLASIQVTRGINFTVKVPSFTVGTTSPVVVTATKIDNALSSSITLKVKDVAANLTTFDPVDLQLERTTGKPVSYTLTEIPEAESQITLYNGNPGLTVLYLSVNGTKLMIAGLHPNEVRTLDLSAAMVAGSNTIILEARGWPSGIATLLIHD
jgi:hypothetical protein